MDLLRQGSSLNKQSAHLVPRVLCPRCGKLTAGDRRECEYCAVVITKFKITQTYTDGIPPHSVALAEAWAGVCQDYANEDRHHQFLARARAEDSLPVAAARYVSLIKLMPNDALCARMLGEVEALGQAMLWDFSVANRPARGAYQKVWLLPLIAGSVFVAVIPEPIFALYSGLGAMMIYVALIARVFFRR